MIESYNCAQDSDVVELKLGLTMQHLLDVDTNVQTMTGIYWLNLEWRDEYLVWDKEKYGVSYINSFFQHYHINF